MDFSGAGYQGGGVKLPTVAGAQRLTPVAGDNTAPIQAALDRATGAVVLAPGEYEIAGTLSITRSGVVLRGEKGASIRLTGSPHRFLDIRGAGAWREEGTPVPIIDEYVPCGATNFQVRDGSQFHAGDRVLVLHPVSTVGVIRIDRMIETVSGDRITLDVPLSDALDSKVGGASLVRYSFPGRITEAGVEGLRIKAAPDAQYSAIGIDALEDGWVRDLEIQDAQNGIAIGPGVKRLTVVNVRMAHSAAAAGPAAGFDFALQGTQILLDRCSTTGESEWPVVTQGEATGPLVLLNFAADHGGVAPHQRWGTGVLVDAGQFRGGSKYRPGVAFTDCANAGSKECWRTAWSVAWNVSSPFLLVQQPPGTMNWCIGCIGTAAKINGESNGVFDSLGKMVHPSSLYLQQLRDRLGPEAVRNIGYADNRIKLL
jgi:hypothetical protein